MAQEHSCGLPMPTFVVRELERAFPHDSTVTAAVTAWWVHEKNSNLADALDAMAVYARDVDATNLRALADALR